MDDFGVHFEFILFTFPPEFCCSVAPCGCTDGNILILGTPRRSHASHQWQLVPFLKWKMSLSS